ncbi:MAG: MBL fold metallo-hydrolase [Kiritimatiellae bacterium]|nr:MBL fold metallo-hydrolase [Kiritimatiellia bacterium]
MRIVLGGVRGSSPQSHPDFLRFGGATSCVLVESGSGARIVLDAGTGLNNLLKPLAVPDACLPVLMLFTHYHLDHLIGLPPFAPLYDPAWNVVFAAPIREGITVEAALKRLVGEPFWPALFRASQRFEVLPETADKAPFPYGPFRVRWCAVHHRNGCHAYRIDAPENGESMAFVTDLEWGASNGKERADLLRLCGEPRPVDVLIMEGHGETAQFAGWGHSLWKETVEVAKKAGVRQLVITHHAPDDDDRALLRREQEVQETMPNACLGHEGMQIDWNRGSPIAITVRPV